MTDAGELHKEKRSFARVPSAMIHDSRISSGALRCYAHMHWRYGQNHLNFEGRKSISTYLGVSETMVTRYLKELEAYGWIVVVIREPDQKTGQRKTPYYHVFEKRKASDIFRKEYACKPGETLRAKSKIEHRKLRSGKGGRPTHKEKTPETVAVQGKEAEESETQVYVYANSSSHGHVNSSSHGDQVNSSSPALVNSSSHELDAVKDYYLDAKELKESAPQNGATEVLSHRQSQISEPEIAPSPSKKSPTPTDDEIKAFITAWIQNLPAPPTTNQYGRTSNRNAAKGLIKGGYTHEQMARFMAALYTQAFWQGKMIPLTHIADHMPAWLKGATTPPRPSPAPTPTAPHGVGLPPEVFARKAAKEREAS